MTPLQEAEEIFNFYYRAPNVTIQAAKCESLFLVHRVIRTLNHLGKDVTHWKSVEYIIENAETLILEYEALPD